MSHTNPFDVFFVMTVIVIVTVACIGVAGTSIPGLVALPSQPAFPTFPSINAQGNLTGAYLYTNSSNCYIGTSTVFSDFSPIKQVVVSATGISIQRQGAVFLGLGTQWNTEPTSYLNGSLTGPLTAQLIINNFNGTYSNFIVDYANNLYTAALLISPIGGYSMSNSWNVAHGFYVTVESNAYVAPSWTDQAVSFLTFLGALVSYVFLFLYYLVLIAAAFVSLIMVVPALGAVVVLVGIIWIGSLLLFIRGGSTSK